MPMLIPVHKTPIDPRYVSAIFQVDIPRYCLYMTPLILVGYALDWARADAVGDLEHHEATASMECKAYGVKGKVYHVQY